MRFLIAVILLFLASIVGAATYANVMWVCTNKNAIKFDTSNKVTVKADGAYTAPVVTIIYPSVSVGNTNGNLLKINTNGSLTVKGE